jgi:crotonobetainyl-CoA:carnitine CoA-transferase CaiB-like acyl-CoA transferase
MESLGRCFAHSNKPSKKTPISHYSTPCSVWSINPELALIQCPAALLSLANLQRLPPKPAPVLGEQTDEILSEILGISDTEISKLHEDKIVAGPRR